MKCVRVGVRIAVRIGAKNYLLIFCIHSHNNKNVTLTLDFVLPLARPRLAVTSLINKATTNKAETICSLFILFCFY
jgi:hypothetical protein